MIAPRLSQVILATLAVALLIGCPRPFRPDQVRFPSETLYVSGRSHRPAVFTTLATPAPPPPVASPQPPAPISSTVTIKASAEATLPSARLDPRLAALAAQEQARLAVLNAGLEQLAARRRAPPRAAAAPGEETLARLAESVTLRRRGNRVQARLNWALPASFGLEEISPPPPPPPASITTRRLEEIDEATREEMRREARGRAITSLRDLLMHSEVAPGLTMRRWLGRRSIPPGTLDALLLDAPVSRTDLTLDEETQRHVCEVIVAFDRGELNRLR